MMGHSGDTLGYRLVSGIVVQPLSVLTVFHLRYSSYGVLLTITPVGAMY